jgi:hypothetical protein
MSITRAISAEAALIYRTRDRERVGRTRQCIAAPPPDLSLAGVDGAFLAGGLASDDFDIAGFCGCSVSEMSGRCNGIIIRRTAAKTEP